MKIGTIKKSLEPLLNDAFESEKLLEENRDSQFIRRLYIKNLFSYIEGSVWVLKQVCLKAKMPDGSNRKISVSEYSILAEISYDLKNNGDIKTVTTNLNILDNVKFTFKTVNKLFHGKIDIGVGTNSWSRLSEAKKIRNRITHPKNETDMIVTDDEISTCELVGSWFNDLIAACFQLFISANIEKTK